MKVEIDEAILDNPAGDGSLAGRFASLLLELLPEERREILLSYTFGEYDSDVIWHLLDIVLTDEVVLPEDFVEELTEYCNTEPESDGKLIRKMLSDYAAEADKWHPAQLAAV